MSAKSNQPKRGIVFDFDGVIADSFAQHEAAWRRVLANHQVNLDDEVLIAAIGWSSLDSARAVCRVAELAETPASLAAEKDAAFTELVPSIKPMSGAVAACQRLHGEFAIAIASARQRQVIEPMLAQFELPGCYDALIALDDLPATAELDDLFTLAAKQLSLEPAQCVLVEDSRNGILAAKRAGLAAIAFASNPKYPQDFSMADAQINALDELLPELVNQVLAD